jgi:hypothetical protein
VLGAAILVVGCSSSGDVPQEPKFKSFRGLGVERSTAETLFSKYLEVKFQPVDSRDQRQRSMSSQGSEKPVIVELIGDDDDLGEIKLTFHWAIDYETGKVDYPQNTFPRGAIDLVCRQLKIDNPFDRLFQQALSGWTAKKGGVAKEKIGEYGVVLSILGRTPETEGHLATGKSLFVIFQVRHFGK